MANNKLSAFLSLLLVFCSGIVVGGVGYRVYAAKVSAPTKPPERRSSPEEFKNHLIEEMKREVHLDNRQIVELGQIYDDTRARFDEARAGFNSKLHAEGQAIHDQQVDKIKKILRPEQIPLYDSLRARHEAERAARHKGDIKKDQ